MSRADLLAFTIDDLALLTNRGMVNRAKRELEQFTFELTEVEDGLVLVQWSDQVECALPSGETLSDRHCTCSATTVCRHLIRSILAYQHSRSSPTLSPWNPGTISDATLAQHFSAAQLKRLKQQFEADQVIEVQCSSKPIAYLHSLGHTLRFLVPDDLRYTYCDCSDPAPCLHVPIAVWAFRQLHHPTSAIISTERHSTTPTHLLNDLESVLESLFEVGLGNLTPSLLGKLKRCEQQCRQSHLVWFAEIVAELLQQCDSYQKRDARFSAQQVVELIAELCIRSDALRAQTGKVPRLFIAGAKHDRGTELGPSRLIALGCGAQIQQNRVTLTNYFQDANTGIVTALSNEFDDPAPFAHLAQQPVLKQHTSAELGSGQLLIQCAKRLPDFRLLPGRSAIALNPQSFRWEQLRAPLLVDDFAELSAHLQLLPPADLRPRRLIETLHVLSIAKITSVEFSQIQQSVTAVLWDAQQNTALLKFPYMNRAHAGTAALLTQLAQQPLRFVSGHVTQRSNQLIVSPIGLVFEQSFLQPWIAPASSANLTFGPGSTELERDPIEAYLDRVLNAIADLLLIGVEQTHAHTLQTWQEISEAGEKLEFEVLLDAIVRIKTQLNAPNQDLHSLTQSILKLAVLHRLAFANA